MLLILLVLVFISRVGGGDVCEFVGVSELFTKGVVGDERFPVILLLLILLLLLQLLLLFGRALNEFFAGVIMAVLLTGIGLMLMLMLLLSN